MDELSSVTYMKVSKHLRIMTCVCVCVFLVYSRKVWSKQRSGAMGMPLSLWPFGGHDPFELMMADMQSV